MYYCLLCEEYTLIDAMEFDDNIGYCGYCNATTDDMILLSDEDIFAISINAMYTLEDCNCEDYPCCGH
jgi:hypothetical protein